MMKLFKVISASFLALSFAGIASAQHQGQRGQNFKSEKDRPAHHRGLRKSPTCKIGKLSADQRTQLRTVRQGQMKEMKALQAELKAARVEFRKVITNAESTIEEAQAANLVVQTKMNSVTSARQAARLKLMYEVLDAEQRVKLAKCFKRSARHHHHKAPVKRPLHRRLGNRG